ncbi:fatty acid synthase-like [Brevipalpus obovatus]|uniref:fatty acid synthase-like n=1 Tax=Brevipalpus obovatus TaxID=246614 RepID=UPI003D9DD12F
MPSIIDQSTLVVSGISGRYPQSNSVDELWEKICKGLILYEKDPTPYPKVFKKLPKSRGLIKDPDRFDNEFFGISSEEADSMDAQVRVLHEVTFEALWDAGIDPSSWRGTKTGVFIGSFGDDIDRNDRKVYDSAPTRISYSFDFRGPCVRVDTACASSLSALHLAMLSIEAGECSQAIVAGVCIHQKPMLGPGFIEYDLLSSSGGSWVLDSRADGFVRAEAVVAVVIQQASNARRAYANILSCVSNTDGYTVEGILHPHKDAQKAAMKEALAKIDLHPSEIEYVEAHLTGTQAGDTTECAAIMEAYRGDSQQKIMVGTLKANLGHTEAGAGLSGLTKVVKIFQNKLLPPNIGPERPNEKIEGLASGQIVPIAKPKHFAKDIIALDAFGYGGANCTVILGANTEHHSSCGENQEIILLCNRTKLGLEKMRHKISCQLPKYLSALPLLNQIAKTKPETGMEYRTFGLVRSDRIDFKEIARIDKRASLGIIFGELLETPFLPREHCNWKRELLKPYDQVIKSNSSRALQNFASTMILIDLLALLLMKVDFCLGESLGKILVEYSSGKKSRKQALDSFINHGNGFVRNSDYISKLLSGENVAEKIKNAMNRMSKHPSKLCTPCTLLVLDKRVRLINLSEIKVNEIVFDSIYELIGNLYTNGHNVDLGKLWPLKGHVDRETPSLSPLIDWKHDQKFCIDWYPQFFNNSNTTHHHIDLMDPEYSNIQDHVIDGRILMPGAGYLYLIARNEICVHGFASLQFDDCPEEETSLFTMDTLDLCLNRDEVYSIMKIQGYDFKKHYQLNHKVKVARSQSLVSYDSDMMAVFDSLLQLDKFWRHLPDLYVPVSVSNFYFEHRSFLQSVREFHDELNRIWIARSQYDGNVSINGIFYSGIKWRKFRRNTSSSEPRYARLTFAPYFDQFRLSEKLAKNRSDYIESCKQILIGSKSNGILVDDGTATSKTMLTLLSEIRKLSVKKEDSLKSLVKNHQDHLDDDLILRIPMESLSSSLDLVAENLNSKPTISISTIGSLPSYLKTNISKRYSLWRKNCHFTSFSSISKDSTKIHDQDLVIAFGESMRILMEMNESSDESIISSCKNAAQHLKEGSFVLVINRLSPDELEKSIVSQFGMKINSPKIFIDQQESTLLENGMILVSRVDIEISTIRMQLFRKPLKSFPVNIKCFDIDDQNNFNWLEDLKTAMNDDECHRIWLRSTKSDLNGIVGLFRCLALEPNGDKIRCVFIGTDKLVELSKKEFEHLQRVDLVLNIQQVSGWGHFILHDLDLDSEMLIQSSHFKLEIGNPGIISSLRWIESGTKALPNESLIKITASAINFKDVLIANAVIPSDAYPTDRIYGIGHEFSGRTSDGRRVFGLIGSGAFSSHIRSSDAKFLLPIPDNWTDEEATTVPLCYITAYYSLISRARIQSGESVLIHAGSGGVGLAAISICLARQCKVYTTVSNKEKQKFIQNLFPSLRDECFTDSRSTKFEEHIMIQTGGHGVDVVLNSLSGDKIDASIRCLASGGRFVEIGKRDIIENRKLDRNGMMSSVSFETVCIGFLWNSADTDNRIANVLDSIKRMIADGLNSGEVKPLPVTVFSPLQVEEAFRHMLKGAHTGKLVLSIGSMDSIPCQKRAYFWPEKCYVIIGGLGGMGLELAHWMASRGAKKIVISSRHGPKTSYQKYKLFEIRMKNPSIELFVNRCDLTTARGVHKCIKEAERLGPIGGIFNLAAVLKDGLFTNQTVANFEIVCGSKIRITELLDKKTRQECPQLDYFVCFSSIAANGNLGQSNYGFGNSYMERVCEKRKADGLPGLAIQWGPVGDVGMAARKFGPNDIIGGYQSQKINSCMASLDIFLTSEYPVCFSAIPAENKKADTSDLLLRIGRILGLKDIKSIDENKTLRELGLDSVQAIEIQHFLGQEKGFAINYATLIEITLRDLKNAQSQDTSDLKNSKLSQTGKILVKLNDKVNDPVFFFPPGVGDFVSMQELAQTVDRAVIGVDIPPTLTSDTKDFGIITDSLCDQILEAYPDFQEYNFVGYSMGVTMCFDVARKMQQRCGENRVNRLIFIDNSPWGNVNALKYARLMEKKNRLTWNALKDLRNIGGVSATDRNRMVKALEVISGESDPEKNFEIFFRNWRAFDSAADLEMETKFKGEVYMYMATVIVAPFLERLCDSPEKNIDGPIRVEKIDSNHFQICQHGLETISDGIMKFFPLIGQRITP